MKKLFFLWLGLICIVSMVFTACDFIIDIKSVELIEQPDNATFEIGKFNFDEYSIQVTYTDGSTETVKLEESMLSDYNKMLLNSVGEHEIKVTYEGYEFSFRVNMEYRQVEDNEEEQSVKPYLTTINEVYDGNAKIVKVEGDIPENATIYYPNGQSFVDAGEYTATAIIVAEGYETMELSSKVIIQKANYDLSGLQLVVDYGVDKENKPLTSFVFDGQEHSATLVGEIPQGLSEPEFLIGLRNKPVSSYTSGNSAIYAGSYTVIARFTGDTKNYNIENLDIKTDLIIDKKPISQTGFDDLTYPVKYVDYDGLPHRYVIEDLDLPEGVSIEYVDENGKQFGYRTEANEEGYKITAKFVSNDTNYDLTNTIDLVLVIRKVAYKIDPKDIVIGFGTEQAVDFDDEYHNIMVNGLVDGITVKKLTVNGEEGTTSFKNAGTYDVYVEFNPFSSNYLPIDPIQVRLTINQIDFVDLVYQFSDKLNEVYDENGHSLEYFPYALPKGVTVQFTYTTDQDFETYEGIPTNIVNVGTYTCIGKFIYDKNNYKDAPASVADAMAIMTISTRQYDAKSIIQLQPIRTSYEVDKNHIDSCTFSEKLPSWVTSYRVLVYTNDGVTSTREVIDAGEYQYEFEFFYFNGIENTSAKSNRQVLKVVGETINSTNYRVTYTSTGIYDGVHSCLPSIELFFDESLNAEWSLEYTYQRFDSDYVETVKKSDWEITSVNAGTHVFTYTITAKNYETYKRTYTVVVDRLPLQVDHNCFVVHNYEGIYDGKFHGNQIVVDDSYDDKDYIIATPKLLNSSKEGLQNGQDVGIFEYTVSFTSTDPNVYLVLDSFYSFNYTVTIHSLEMEKPQDLVTFSIDDEMENKSITVSKSEKFYTTLATFMGVNSDTPITTTYFGFQGTYSLLGYDLLLSMPTKQIEYTSLTNITYVVYNKDKNTVNTYNSMEAVNDEISNAGNYYVLVKFNTDNIVVNGLPGILYQVCVDAQSITLSNPEKVNGNTNSAISKKSQSTFNLVGEGISSLTGDDVDEISSFNGAIMLNFSETYFGAKLIMNLQKGLSSGIVSDMGAKFYLVKLSTNGELIVNSSTFDSIFTMKNGDALYNKNTQVTDAGIYYVFVDLGTNYSYLSNRRIVYKVEILGYELGIKDFVDIVDNTQTTVTPAYNASNYRKYVTEKNKFIFSVDGSNTPITNADNVNNTVGFNGTNIYTYTLTCNGKMFSFDFLKGLEDFESLSSLKMNVIFASYGVSNGGKVLNTTATTFFNKSGITIDTLESNVNQLCLTSSNTFTPVSVYYLFITLDSNSILVNGSNKIAICVQVNLDKNLLNYTYGGNTYNYLTNGFVGDAYVKNFVANQYQYMVEKSELPCASYIASVSNNTYTMNTSLEPSLWFGNHQMNNFTVVFDSDTLGGLTLNIGSVTMNVSYTKKTIDLESMFTEKLVIKQYPNGDVVEYNGDIIDLNAFHVTIQNYFANKLIAAGVDTKLATYFANNYVDYSYDYSYSYDIGDNPIELYIGFPFVNSSLPSDLQQIQDEINGLFTITNSGTSYTAKNHGYKFKSTTSKGITISIAKKKIFVTRWAYNNGTIYSNTMFLSTDLFVNGTPNKDKFLSKVYELKGYESYSYYAMEAAPLNGRTNRGLLVNCILDDSYHNLNQDDFVSKCITIMKLDDLTYTFILSLTTEYAKYYEICERKIHDDFTEIERTVVSDGVYYFDIKFYTY